MQSREELLKRLINYEGSLINTIEELNKYDWDLDENLVVLTREHISNVLSSFLTQKISDGDIVDWANAIEMRDGIEYEKGYEKLISTVLFHLSTPEINYPIKKEYMVGLLANIIFR